MKLSKLARRTAGVTAAVVLSGGQVTVGLIAGAGPAASAQAPAATAGASRMVTLINGDRVAVTTTPSGVQVNAVARVAGGADGALIRLNLDGQAYDIPADALPYLGRGLSPALFEVSSLLSLESGGRLPVQVSYQGQLPTLPGVVITVPAPGLPTGT
jgi:hypothetical protein